ncbi:MAG: histidine kinase [Bacteroidales bacterium]|nr:histidine kinase [Bacteroidales bacterium]
MKSSIKSFLSVSNWNYRILYFLLSPAFLALILASIIILFLPDFFNKYQADINLEKRYDRDGPAIFTDLDSDGISESIDYTRNSIGNPCIKINRQLSSAIEQYNFRGEYLTDNILQKRFSLGDFDQDGNQEVYVLIARNDSIFLQVMEPFGKGYFIKDRFVDTIFQKMNRYDIRFGDRATLEDINGGNKEFIFLLSAGFSLHPRRIYAYDLDKDTLLKTPLTGAALTKMDMADIDHDGKKEIIASSIAYDNIHENLEVPYKDSCSWLMIYDHHLQYQYKPIPFTGKYGNIRATVFNDSSIMTHQTKKIDRGRKSILHWYQVNDGKLLKTKEEVSKINMPLIFKKFDRYFLIKKQDPVAMLYEVDGQLNKLDSIRIPVFSNAESMKSFDINKDGINELILCFRENIIIMDENLNHPINIDLTEYEKSIENNNENFYVSLYKKGSGKPNVLISSNYRNVAFIKYTVNPLYGAQYLIYLGIFLGLFLFIWMIRRLFQFEMNRRNAIQRELAETKALLFQSQMDPHFVHNTLNAVAASILKEDKHTAYNNLLKFSRLSRLILEKSDLASHTLEQEIDFVNQYLEIQKFRFSNQFDYSVVVNHNVDKYQQVPKMVIHTYVENSIRHGLRAKKGQGMLKVTVTDHSNDLKIFVEDDGIGRVKSSEFIKNTTGRGLKTINSLYDLFNKANERNITEHFEDIIDEHGEIIGTRVEICIPKGYRFTLP